MLEKTEIVSYKKILRIFIWQAIVKDPPFLRRVIFFWLAKVKTFLIYN